MKSILLFPLIDSPWSMKQWQPCGTDFCSCQPYNESYRLVFFPFTNDCTFNGSRRVQQKEPEVQNARPVAAIVSANELFTPALVSLESCRLLRLTVYRMEMREEAVNVCVHFPECVCMCKGRRVCVCVCGGGASMCASVLCTSTRCRCKWLFFFFFWWANWKHNLGGLQIACQSFLMLLCSFCKKTV